MASRRPALHSSGRGEDAVDLAAEREVTLDEYGESRTRRVGEEVAKQGTKRREPPHEGRASTG